MTNRRLVSRTLQLLTFSTALIILVGARTAGDKTTCLVLDAGNWWPYSPGEIWNGPSTIELTPKADPTMGPAGWTKDWRAAWRGDPALSEYNRAWLWRSPAGDSLQILRPAILSEGIEFRGIWRGDTLFGRGHAFSDVTGFSTPRANSYGLRFTCGDHLKELVALGVVAQFRARDVPDTVLSAHEDSVWLAGISRMMDSLRKHRG